ncbi:MAG: nucleoside hydrolase [Actinomycetota bacterium]|nr:nucleoside hydrolase [Actinomycetota bacterium]
MSLPVVLDVDTGVDDALAILFAVRTSVADLRGVSCVGGNAPAGQVLRNTLAVLAEAGATDVDVAIGTDGPDTYVRTQHGRDAMADLALVSARTPPPVTRAVDLLGVAAAGGTTVVAAGPLTNVARALDVHRCMSTPLVVVGGEDRDGALVPGEDDFNLTHDPLATRRVLRAPMERRTLYPMRAFRAVTVPQRAAERMAAAHDPVTRLAGRLLVHQCRRGGGDGRIGDAGALVATAHPEVVRGRRTASYGGQASVILDVDPSAVSAAFLDVFS